MTGTPRLVAAVAALATSVALAWATLHQGAPTPENVRGLLGLYAACAATFVAGAWLVCGLPRRQALALTLAGGALLQAVAVGFSPTTTDDFWRYLWDGKVQAAGVDPYRYAPLDPALAPLRDEILFPPDPRSPEQAAAAIREGRTDICTTAGEPHDCTRINRPGVRTIYPPVAQAAFAGLHYVDVDGHRVRSLQAAMGLLALAVTVALIWALRRGGRDPRRAVLWAWCPIVWLECANNAHIDVLGVALLIVCLGLLAARAGPPPSARRLIGAGALFGAAVAVKLVPVLVLPALLIRRGQLLLAAAAAVFALGYLPHVAAIGTDVVGYLPGYLEEEGYDGGQRFGVPRLLFPDAAAPVVAALLGTALAGWVWRRADARPAPRDALVLVGVAFVLVGPSQPWYGLLIVALAALADRPEWLAVAAAAYPVYLAGFLEVDNTTMAQLAYGTAALVVAAGTLSARRAGSRRSPAACTART